MKVDKHPNDLRNRLIAKTPSARTSLNKVTNFHKRNYSKVNNFKPIQMLTNDESFEQIIKSMTLKGKGENNLIRTLLFVLTLVVSIANVMTLRYTIFHSGEVSNTQIDLENEIRFLCIKYQAQTGAFLIICFFSKLVISKLNKGQEVTSGSDVGLSNIFSIVSLKYSLASLASFAFCLIGTKFIPASFMIFYKNCVSGVLYLASKRLKKHTVSLILIMVSLALTFSLVLNGVEVFPAQYEPSPVNMAISIFSATVSGFILVWMQNFHTEKICRQSSPIEFVNIVNVNSTLILTGGITIYNILFDKGNPFKTLIGWLFNVETFVYYSLVYGALGVANATLVIFSSAHLSTFSFKLMKIIELFTAEILAISVFRLYNFSRDLFYWILLTIYTFSFVRCEVEKMKV